jgi:hypothetical protein
MMIPPQPTLSTVVHDDHIEISSLVLRGNPMGKRFIFADAGNYAASPMLD